MEMNTVLLQLKKYDKMQETLINRKNLIEEQHEAIKKLKNGNADLLKYISDSYIETIESYMLINWEKEDFGEYSSYNQRLKETVEIGNKYDDNFGKKLINKITDLKHGSIESVEN